MNRAHLSWPSIALGRRMDLLVFGHAGARVIAFPTSMGHFHDWEDRGLIANFHEHFVRGWIQMFCVDSVDAESWYNERAHPAERARRHAAYDRYIEHELLPFSAAMNANPFVIVTGASFGGYHAVNFALRHPNLVGRLISMSGLCDIRRFTDGYYDDNIYFNNPCDFIGGEQESRRLEILRRVDIILAVGREDSLRASNEQLSGHLWAKNIPHALRIWDGFAHDWPFWAEMLKHYIAGSD